MHMNGVMAPARKVALIIGITGQDGSYLTKFLLDKGYEVHDRIRRSSNFNTQRINHIYVDPQNSHKARMKLHYVNLSDTSSLCRWLNTILPDEVYNLVAQSHITVSFEIPDYIIDVVATSALRLLEVIRSHIRYYQAGSSEMFGATPLPQSETTLFHPRSPYAASKCVTLDLQSSIELQMEHMSSPWKDKEKIYKFFRGKPRPILSFGGSF